MKRKVIYVEIKQDWKMIISEWLIFIIGIVFVSSLFVPIIKIIKEYPDDGMKLGLLVIFVFAMLKVVTWVRMPHTYSTNDISQEIRLDLENNKFTKAK